MRFNPDPIPGDTDPPDKLGHVNTQNDRDDQTNSTASVEGQFDDSVERHETETLGEAEAEAEEGTEDMDISLEMTPTDPIDENGQPNDQNSHLNPEN